MSRCAGTKPMLRPKLKRAHSVTARAQMAIVSDIELGTTGRPCRSIAKMSNGQYVAKKC
jgi:hypothetical protein